MFKWYREIRLREKKEKREFPPCQAWWGRCELPCSGRLLCGPEHIYPQCLLPSHYAGQGPPSPPPGKGWELFWGISWLGAWLNVCLAAGPLFLLLIWEATLNKHFIYGTLSPQILIIQNKDKKYSRFLEGGVDKSLSNPKSMCYRCIKVHVL